MILTIIGLARNKVLAVLLGPAGVGLAGLYFSLITVLGTLTGLGVGYSGVRQIAEANRSGEKIRVAQIAIVIGRVLAISNIIGALILCLFSRQISQATFGDTKHAFGVAEMSLVLVFTGISGGQMAILQGLQRIKDLITCAILGSLVGSLVSVIVIFFLRERGVAWFLVINAVFAFLSSWWFSRQIKLVSTTVSLGSAIQEAKALFGLGIGLMSAVLLTSAVAYFTRMIVIRTLGLTATGQYQAAYMLSAYYVGFILNAISLDFYPKLSGVSKNNREANRLMNDQIEIGLLLAIPGLTATLVLAPWVLRFCYTGAFVAATAIVQWAVIGVFFSMISWPLRHLQMAKGLGSLLIITETVFAALQIFLNWVCITKWGLQGAGIAYMLSFVAHAAGMYILCRRLSGFAWSRRVLLISLPGLLLLMLSFAAVKLLPIVWGAGLGLGFCVVACAASLYGFQKVLGLNIKTMLSRRFALNSLEPS